MSERRAQSWPMRVFGLLSRMNYAIALIGGVVLLATVIFILVDIFLRQFAGRGLGGSDEISGYVIAGVAAWGFSYALVERAHVRIDVLTGRLPAAGRAIFRPCRRCLPDLRGSAGHILWLARVLSLLGERFTREYAARNPSLDPAIDLARRLGLADVDGGYREHLCGCADADAAFRYCANAWRYRLRIGG